MLKKLLTHKMGNSQFFGNILTNHNIPDDSMDSDDAASGHEHAGPS